MKYFLLFISTIALSLVSAPTLFATPQEPSLAVSPAITEWEVQPGEALSKNIRVINKSDQPLPIKVGPGQFLANEDVPQEKQHLYSSFGWFTISESAFILPPKETKEVEVKLEVPASAEPGGHYATIYFHQLSEAQSGTSVVGRVGTLAFITVGGDIHKSLTSRSFSVKPQAGEYTISDRLENTGNVHVTPKVTFKIYDIHGKEIHQETLANIILPYTQRDYTTTWQPPFFGKYTITSEVTLGDKVLSTSSATIWHLPILETLVILGIILFGYFGVYRIRHRWQRAWKALRKST